MKARNYRKRDDSDSESESAKPATDTTNGSGSSSSSSNSSGSSSSEPATEGSAEDGRKRARLDTESPSSAVGDESSGGGGDKDPTDSAKGGRASDGGSKGKSKDGDDDNNDDDGDDDHQVRAKLEALKELQKFRSKKAGVNVIGLAIGEKVKTLVDELIAPDPFKLKHGGLVDRVKDRDRDRDDDDDKNYSLSTTFSIETKARDEDKMMLNYIEQELAKRKGIENAGEKRDAFAEAQAKLYELPDNLQIKSQLLSSQSEDMISSSMLSGIPEVQLGINARIKNIEETHKARQEMLQKGQSQSAQPVLHHQRFFQFHDRSEHGKRNGQSGDSERKFASDDAMFDKFKKRSHRY